MARFMTRLCFLSVLGLAFASLAACGDDDGPALCEEDVTLSFGSLSGSEVSDFTIGGTRVEVLSGVAQGWHDGERWTLLVPRGGQIALTPPCIAAELEVVIDLTQVGMEAELYATSSAEDYIGSGSTVGNTEPVQDATGYSLWTVSAPEGDTFGYVTLTVPGTECPLEDATCTSVLIRSTTFR